MPSATEVEREPIYYPPGTKKPKPPLPIWKVRESGSQTRKNVKVKRVADAQLQQQRHANTMEQLSARQQQRIQFRREVEERSVSRENRVIGLRRRERYLQSGERFAGDVAEKSGARPAGVSILGGVVRIFVAIVLLSMLFLIVTKAQQTGTAFSKVGSFLSNLTSGQPLFVKT